MLDYGLLINVFILLIALVILDRGSLLAIDGATGFAEATGLAASTVGFVILATSTSIPEAAVSFTASIDREFGIAIGNVLGSNIANICLIIGVPTIYLCFKGIYCIRYLPKMEKHEIDSLFFGLLIASVVPLYLAYREYASMSIGIILLVIFLVYNIYLSRTGIIIKDLGVKSSHKSKKFGKELLRLIFGVAIVVLCAYFIVNSASNIAEAFGIVFIFI